ncbi:MAG: hypothetical protein WC647_10185 [Desulfomonilaceae bacterium]
MPRKRSAIDPDRLPDSSLFVTREEFNQCMASLQEQILLLKNQHLNDPLPLPDAPRPRIFHKKKEGKREKLATTVDANLFELVKQRQQAGQQLSHIIDSCIWHFFGRPKLSFQSDDND